MSVAEALSPVAAAAASVAFDRSSVLPILRGNTNVLASVGDGSAQVVRDLAEVVHDGPGLEDDLPSPLPSARGGGAAP